MTRNKHHADALKAAECAHHAVTTGKHEWRQLIELHGALLSAWNYADKHGTDPELQGIMRMLTAALAPYLSQRLAAPGVRRSIETWKRRITIDAARLAMVERIEQHGIGRTRACELAGEILQDHGHPAGSTEAGEYADESTIRKSCERAKAAMIPPAIWQLPGEIEMQQLPDPAPYIDK